MADGDRDELDPPPAPAEEVDQGLVFVRLLLGPGREAEVSREAHLDEEEGTLSFVEGGSGVRVGNIRDAKRIYEVLLSGAELG